MVKFISKILNSKIILFQERVMVGTVERVLIDPDDGRLVGLALKPRGSENLYVPIGEVKGFGQGLVIVEELGSLSEADEVIKIKSVLEKEPRIIGAAVFTEGGRRVGRVEDATIDLRFSILKKLYVNPKNLGGILGEQKIIDAKQIVRIEKERIIVKDGVVKVKGRLGLPAQMPVAE